LSLDGLGGYSRPESKKLALKPIETLRAGDDPVRDWKGAESAGLSIFRLERPGNSLRDLLLAL